MAARPSISALSRAASLTRQHTTKTTAQTQTRLLHRVAAAPCLPLSRSLPVRAAPRAVNTLRQHAKVLAWVTWRGYSTEKDAPAVGESKIWDFETVRDLSLFRCSRRLLSPVSGGLRGVIRKEEDKKRLTVLCY